jgi:hypothetical protein
VSLKLKNGICFTNTNFDPSTATYCLLNEKCYSIQSKMCKFIIIRKKKLFLIKDIANETMINDLDINTIYKVQLEYTTKFKTRGVSNLLEIKTSYNSSS